MLTAWALTIAGGVLLLALCERNGYGRHSAGRMSGTTWHDIAPALERAQARRPRSRR